MAGSDDRHVCSAHAHLDRGTLMCNVRACVCVRAMTDVHRMLLYFLSFNFFFFFFVLRLHSFPFNAVCSVHSLSCSVVCLQTHSCARQ